MQTATFYGHTNTKKELIKQYDLRQRLTKHRHDRHPHESKHRQEL